MLSTPFPSLMTTLVIAIALMLPATLHLLIDNGKQLSGQIDASNRISVFLKQGVSNDEADRLTEKINSEPTIESSLLITKEQALEEFQAFSGFSGAIETLAINPLPAVIQISPASSIEAPEQLQQLLEKLEKLPETDFVQLDMQWAQRLHAIIGIAERGIMLLAILLALAVLLIIGNTIRLELQNRKDEIIITKLVGATDRFIRRPFLYSGFWFGLLGGLFAWLLTQVILLLLTTPSEKLATLYSSDFQLHFLDFTSSLALLGTAILLGVLGAWIACSQHLKNLQPE